MVENTAIRSRISTGVIAGLAGGVLIEAASFAAIFVMTGTLDVIREFQLTAAELIGKSALANPQAAWLGIAVHFAISVAWGIGYVYVAEQRPQLYARPIISGFAYGVAVYLLMLLLDLATGVTNAPELSSLGNALVAYTFFFGIPIALIARARRER
jgi:hypothetical protein